MQIAMGFIGRPNSIDEPRDHLCLLSEKKDPGHLIKLNLNTNRYYLHGCNFNVMINSFMKGKDMKSLFCGCLLLTLISSNVYADSCNIEVKVGDNMNFVPTALSVSASACETVTINLTHTGSIPRNAMGHNWVLSATADAQATAQEGWTSGLDNQYLKLADNRVIAHTKIVGGGESDSVSFKLSDLKVGGDYTFFCSFVGHFAMMQGKFTIVE